MAVCIGPAKSDGRPTKTQTFFLLHARQYSARDMLVRLRPDMKGHLARSRFCVASHTFEQPGTHQVGASRILETWFWSCECLACTQGTPPRTRPPKLAA